MHEGRSSSALVDLYASTDIVLMPSCYESFGLVAIEAMAAGSVPICFAVGGLKEVVVDGQNGVLVAPGDDAAYCDKVIDLARDGKRLSRLSRGARASFEEKYTVEIMAQMIEADLRTAYDKGVKRLVAVS
ncbi:glycosyltransferase family 4 protein [Lichenihabitans sp. PAMC28606]|nr:glycosyltransferase family 4 protein [Lichenihabitans sp. PAMC28606]